MNREVILRPFLNQVITPGGKGLQGVSSGVNERSVGQIVRSGLRPRVPQFSESHPPHNGGGIKIWR